MDHIQPEELAVLALDGTQPDGPVRNHLDTCVECRSEYAAMQRTVSLGRGRPDSGSESPPSSVWTAIHAELDLDPSLANDPLAGAEPTGIASEARPLSTSRRSIPTDPTGVVGRDRPRQRNWLPVALAAAGAGVLVGIGLTFAIAGLGSGAPRSAPDVLATAQLDAFPGWEATGSATVEADPDGNRTVVVDLDAAVPPGDVREVWLIRSDASGLVSLGLLDGDSGRFSIPDVIDLAEYTLVDVSAEPIDGEPAHSGDSIVRGELRTRA